MNMKSIRLLTVLLGLVVPFVLRAADGSALRPNVIFVLFDDLGYGQPPSFRADSEFKTPNIDRLAARGTLFEQMMSPHGPRCPAIATAISPGTAAFRARMARRPFRTP